MTLARPIRTVAALAVAAVAVAGCGASSYGSIEDVVRATCRGAEIIRPAETLFAESEAECDPDDGPFIAWFDDVEAKDGYWRLVEVGGRFFGLEVEILDEGDTYLVWQYA